MVSEIIVIAEITDYLTGRKIEMDRFDFEHFDYEEAFRQVQGEVSKPNILICGATGVGKSTMIRDIFQLSEETGPAIGDQGRAGTTGIHAYSPEGSSMTLYDSQGYNIGADEQEYMKDVLGIIGERVRKNLDDMSGHIHEVWYCVSAANNRFFEASLDLLEIDDLYTFQT